MVATYSPHREGGGTFHFPSPTNIHHVDPLAALSQLRRSLSRSPSKGPTFRLVTSKSNSPSPKSPLSPSPLSPPKRTSSFNVLSNSASIPSPLAIPFPPSARKTRPSARRLSPMRTSPRSLAAQRSPVKRGLGESRDSGNVPISSFATPSAGITGIENQHSQFFVSGDKSEMEPPARPVNASSEGLLGPQHARTRRERNSSYFADITAKSSPLKRSDGSMNLDLAQLGSPSAKRRSLHGASFGPDFDIFDYAAAFESQKEKSPTESSACESLGFSDSPTPQSPIPRRTSSLRRTTLQQRYDKPTVTKPKGVHDLNLDSQTPMQPSTRSRQRLSLQNILPTPTKDSPFSSQGLPSASMHLMAHTKKDATGAGNQLLPQRHPLSRTITQSSSSSSVAGDSPTHVPIRHAEFVRPSLDFSRSLPVGAARPSAKDTSDSESVSQASSFATPDNYKLAKPLPAAFMSTGLISKRNKNIDEGQLDFNESIGHMPDTPCKRPVSLAAMAPIPTPDVHFNKSRQGRHTMHSFGTPSTPFNPQVSRSSAGGFGKGVSIFGSGFGGTHSRRGSFLSVNSDDNSQSPSTKPQSQVSTEFDVPPTPTKQVLGSSINQPSVDLNQSGFLRNTENALEESPEASRFHDDPSLSPLFERIGRKAPHTPSESMVPPDPSGLSISVRGEGIRVPLNDSHNSSLALPATPTTSRDSLSLFSNRRSVTPGPLAAPVDVDSSISSRFDKFEIVGTGEFSQVYRVSQKTEASVAQNYFSVQPTATDPKTPLPDKVWAVKKSRQPYIGPKDRQRKLREVEIIRSLGRSDHTIEYIDAWESNNHLYLQTEYCEEGSLDRFLDSVGRNARLDDFRIWKILLELSLGLKHVHDSGFIHLDLKPANILITFEGVLKIADFGMASSWPAPAGIEGEGDREYIGPEILMGQYDKPADVFALGLIMLEIAGNVVLPDNGASWQRLRSGDMSDVPSLTSTTELSNISRDSSGKPLSNNSSLFDDIYGSDMDKDTFEFGLQTTEGQNLSKVQLKKMGELQAPPPFMVDPEHEEALDRLVRWMISPQPSDRPVVDQLLAATGVHWAETRRRAGATIYEGNWGPADEILHHDAEMTDV